MPARFFILILVLICSSCADDKPKKKQPIPTETAKPKGWIIDTIDNPLPENIRFDFNAAYYDSFKTIEIDAIIYNDNSYPVYFLRNYCDLSRGLLYDTSKLGIAGPYVIGNSCQGVKGKIAAYGKYELHEHFNGRTRLETVKLGFDFTPLPSDINEDSLDRFHFLNRTELWAEKPIKTNTAYRKSHIAEYL